MEGTGVHNAVQDCHGQQESGVRNQKAAPCPGVYAIKMAPGGASLGPPGRKRYGKSYKVSCGNGSGGPPEDGDFRRPPHSADSRCEHEPAPHRESSDPCREACTPLDTLASGGSLRKRRHQIAVSLLQTRQLADRNLRPALLGSCNRRAHTGRSVSKYPRGHACSFHWRSLVTTYSESTDGR